MSTYYINETTTTKLKKKITLDMVPSTLDMEPSTLDKKIDSNLLGPFS